MNALGARTQGVGPSSKLGILFPWGLFFISGMVGVAIGVDAALSAKLSLGIIFLLFVAIAATAQKSREPSLKGVRYVLGSLAVTSVLWPPYALFNFGGLPTLDPKKLLLAVLFATLIYLVLSAPSIRDRINARIRLCSWPSAMLLAFMFWRLLSALIAKDPIVALTQYAWECLMFYLVFFAVLASFRGEQDVRAMVAWLTIAVFVVGILAIQERVTHQNYVLATLPATPEYMRSQLAGLAMRIRDGALRVQGTFEHPMALAEFLVFMLPVTGVFYLIANRIQTRVFAAFTLVVVITSIIFSGTRSAMLTAGGIAACALFLVLLRAGLRRDARTRMFISIAGIILLVVLVFGAIGAAATLIAGRTNDEKGSNQARIEQLERGIPKVAAAPLLGVGVGLGNREIGFSMLDGTLYVDNYYLTLALDSGLPAALLFLSLITGFSWVGIRIFFSRDGDIALLAGALSLSLIGVAVIKVVLSIHYNLTFLYLAAAMLVALKDANDSKNS